MAVMLVLALAPFAVADVAPTGRAKPAEAPTDLTGVRFVVPAASPGGDPVVVTSFTGEPIDGSFQPWVSEEVLAEQGRPQASLVPRTPSAASAVTPSLIAAAELRAPTLPPRPSFRLVGTEPGALALTEVTVQDVLEVELIVNPEPGTWALFALGLAAMSGLALRRRRQRRMSRRTG